MALKIILLNHELINSVIKFSFQYLGFLPSSHEEWKKLISHFSEFHIRNSQKIQSRSDEDSVLSLENKSESLELSTENSLESSSEMISWKYMSQLMLCHIGTVEIINILQECDVTDDNCVPVEFYQTAIFSAFINRQQRFVRRGLLIIFVYNW